MLNKDQVRTLRITPSSLPLGSVIEDIHYGKFIKENFMGGPSWIEIHAARGEEPVEVHDTGWSNPINRPKCFVEDPADTYFTEFDIVSVPPGWKIPQPPRRPDAIWKSIPRHPTYEVSSDGRVRRKGQASGKAKIKSKTTGDYILYEKGQPVKWNESKLGDEEAIRKFFAS